MVMTAYVATATQIILPYFPTVHPSSAQFLRSSRFSRPRRRHLDLFIRFCWAHPRAQHTNRLRNMREVWHYKPHLLTAFGERL